jgi:hypothetical protein
VTFVSPVSTIPVVKAYLVTQLKARSELAEPVLVQYGEPGTYLPNDCVAVLDATQSFDVMAMIGSGAGLWLSETYTLDVVVDCFLGGDDPQTVEERALLLAAVVVDVVRLDPSLGGVVIECRPLQLRTSGSWEEEHKGRRGQVTVTLHVEAQL